VKLKKSLDSMTSVNHAVKEVNVLQREKPNTTNYFIEKHWAQDACPKEYKLAEATTVITQNEPLIPL
jgi:hypothetical protein